MLDEKKEEKQNVSNRINITLKARVVVPFINFIA
jgi:hypothetical protein